MKRVIIWIILFIFMQINLGGCGLEKVDTNEENMRNVDYTVVKTEEIPKDFMKKIDETKKKEFKMTYDDGEYLYIAKGYGMQETGGYSIVVDELKSSTDSLFFKTKLVGPGKDKEISNIKTYPYIVLKTEKTNMEVIFR
ncbi:MAG: protease complex subunit PrcB family protein [Agathobacter sp.]|nr:protease complex subunit PrcB family protein [Agathobacter sp.]